MNHLELKLICWAEAMQREMDGNSHSKVSTIHRLMTLGPDGASIKASTYQLPNYWPDSEVRAINEAVWSATKEYRNAIILTYVLRCSLSEAGKQQNITKDQARHRLEAAKKYISSSIIT